MNREEKWIISPDVLAFKTLEAFERTPSGSVIIVDPVQEAAEDLYSWHFGGFRKLINHLREDGFLAEVPKFAPIPLTEEQSQQLAQICEKRLSTARALRNSQIFEALHQVKNLDEATLKVAPTILGLVGVNPNLRVLCTSRESEYYATLSIPFQIIDFLTSEAKPLPRKFHFGLLFYLRLTFFIGALLFAGVFALFGYLSLHLNNEFWYRLTTTIPSAVVASLPRWCFVPAIVLGGLFLYSLRTRKPLIYGVAELLAGIAVAASHVPQGIGEWIALQPWVSVGLSLYMIVRGLDNIGKAIQGTKYEREWHRTFGMPGQTQDERASKSKALSREGQITSQEVGPRSKETLSSR